MSRFLEWAAIGAILAMSVSCGADDATSSAPKPPAKGAKLDDDLSWVRKMAPGGALAYSADKIVYMVELSDRKAKKIGNGLFPEFSPDGSKLAWVDNGGLSVSNRDGSDARQLHDRMFKHGGAHWLDNESLAAILSGPKGYRWYRFWLDGRRQPMPELDQFGINKEKARETDVRKAADGVWTHVAYRSWKTSDGKGGAIDGGCACSISPDAKSITALQGNHTELKIRPVRDGGLSHDLKWLYAGRFDNHRWSSNDERFLIGVREKPATMVIIDWRSGRASAFGKKGHKDKTRMYGDFTKADGNAGKAMPALLPANQREGASAAVSTDRGKPVVLDVWPYRTDGMVYLFESRSAPNEFREFANDPPKSSSGQLRNEAVYDRFGRLDLAGGSYQANSEVNLAGDFAVEFSASGSEGGSPIKLGSYRIEDSASASVQPHHTIVSFQSGNLTIYLNGKRVSTIKDGNSDLTPIVFGDGWSGTLEGIAIFSRPIDGAEAKRRYELFSPRLATRKPAPRAVVDAKLLTYTPPLPLEAMDTYRRCVSEHVFEITKVIEGDIDPGKVRVRSWSTLDMKILPEDLKGKEGQAFRLTLEPEEAHAYLEKLERLNAYDGDDAFELEGFFSVRKPEPAR